MGRDTATDPASELFARFIGRRDAGEALDFEAFCREHPERAGELRTLHADWLHLQEVFEHLGFSASFPDRIRERFGEGVDPEIALAEGEHAASVASPEDVPLLRNGSQTRYTLRDRLGQGGQGEVFSVWDENLRRPLAMKIVDPRPASSRPRTELDSRKLARLLEEAQITAQLDHPGIVPVHELGLDPENRVFFTMKLVKGENLLAVFENVQKEAEGWSTTRALGVLLRVCEAMAYAHQKNVIHRDLKPANVMVGRFGEVYVMDWGLARVLGRTDRKDIRLRVENAPGVAATRADTVELLRNRRALDPDSPLVTMDGDVVGTPAYMPPEQARGELEAMGPPSDVYSLGAILYHLLTGAAPYTRPDERLSNTAVLARVLEGPPEPLRERAPDAPPPLVAICEHAMARPSITRYPSMLALADDLRAYLEGRVVSVYERGLAAELWRWVQRNSALSAALISGVLLVVAGLGTAAYLQGQRLRDARWSSYIANLPLAQVNSRSDAAEAHRRLMACPEDHRKWEWKHVALSSDLASLVLKGHSAAITDVDITADGLLAVSGSADGTARLWDLASGSCQAVLGEGGARVNSVAFSPEGTSVYASSADRQIRVWGVIGEKLIKRLDGPDDAAVQCMDVDSAGRLAAACEDGSLLVWDSPAKDLTPRTLADPNSHLLAVHSLAFGQEGVLVSASRQAVQLWDLTTGEARTIRCATGAMSAASDGSLAMADMLGPGLQIRIPVAGHALPEAVGPGYSSGHAREINCLSFDSAGDFLATGSSDRLIHVWDVQNAGTIASVLPGHESAVTAVAFGNGGRTLISGSEDGSLRVWHSGTRAEHALVAGVWGVLGLAFLGAESELALLTGDGYLTRIDALSGDLHAREFERAWVTQTEITDTWVGRPKLTHGTGALSPDGRHIAIGRLDGHVQLFETSTRTLVADLDGHGARVTGLAFSTEGRRLISSSADGTVRLWELEAPRGLETFSLEGPIPTAVAFLPEGRQILWGSQAGEVGILDLARKQTVAAWPVSNEPVRAMTLSPDATRLACASLVGQLDLWDLERRTKLLMMRIPPMSHGILISALAFSPDGERLAAATEGGGIVLWETRATSAAAWADSWVAVVRSLQPSLGELRAAQGVLEQAAKTMTRDLLQQHFFVDAALASLLQRQELVLPLRELVAQELLALGDLGPEELLEIALDIVIEPERSTSAYQRARLAAETASQRKSENQLGFATLGAAQFRLGETGAALATWEQALSLSGSDTEEALAFTHAFRGLCLARLERPDEAAQELGIARERAARLDSPRLQACIGELERALSVPR
ncbi:MAG: protein kinase [Planctomycetes bacterium]|nr:protein kinase [Planctomycetota bacterium]